MIILAAVPTMYGFMDSPEVTTYNTTNIAPSNTTSADLNCTQNVTRRFTLDNNIGSTIYLTSWVNCTNISEYNENITVTYYFNGSEAGSTNLTNCGNDTLNGVVIELAAVYPDGDYNATWETNYCNDTAPLRVLGNATCTTPLESNGQCLTFTNSSTTTGVDYQFITLTTMIMGLIVLLLLVLAMGYAYKQIK